MLLKFANRTIKIQAVSLVFYFVILVLVIMTLMGLYAASAHNPPEVSNGTLAGIPLAWISAGLLPFSLVSIFLVLCLLAYIYKHVWKGMSPSEMMMHICLLLGNLGFLMGWSR